MTRPQMIRADTIDLQDQHAPSAQDHSRHPTQSSRMGAGRPAPHQNQSMRHAEREAKDEMTTSPRVSMDRFDSEDHDENIDIVYDEPDDLMAEVGGSHDGQNGHYGHMENGSREEEDITDGEGDDLLDDDMMDKISSSPSIDDEDIDFEFVYALHTFVATVEGQANATKGDTMVLLDDSNSYWWLVRVVKDGSIGYLPAEHIETPTERLARLNKHRNIDLSATMLGDNPEKSKNPLKKAMRRRNAKTVTFTSPTYFEASDVDYSTEEEDEEGEYPEDEEETNRAETNGNHDIQDEDIVVEPLRPKPHKEKVSVEPETTHDDERSDRSSPEKSRPSDEFNRPAEGGSRSRNGTLRNTDSFFKDDTAETKKISLTPNLLRDDSAPGPLSSEPKEGRASLESIEKNLASGDKSKRKDKKPGMLSGLFKRKDKKGKTPEDDMEDAEKTSEESSRGSPQPKMSSESVSESRNVKPQVLQRQSSKLQKQPPADIALLNQQNRVTQDPTLSSNQATSPIKEDYNSSIRPVVSPPSGESVAPLHIKHSQMAHETSSLDAEHPRSGGAVSSPIKTVDSSLPTENTLRTYDAVEREDVDDLDALISQSRSITSPPQQFQPKPRMDHAEPLSESPVDVSPTQARDMSRLPGLIVDTSSQDERSISPLSSHTSSPELIDGPDPKVDETTPVSTISSAAASSWSDASLRSYLDDENDIRDLLIIVHDKSNVQPAGPDHPITGSLFKDESRRLKEMSGRLDDMLSSWIAHKTERHLVN